MAKITLADLTAQPTTVELFGGTYAVLAMTRSVQKKFEKAEQLRVAALDEDDSDKVVGVTLDAIDALLQPVGDDAQPAKKVLGDAWKRDELTLGQVGALYNQVQEASLARPT